MATGESDSNLIGKAIVGVLVFAIAAIWLKPEVPLKGSRPEAPEPPYHSVTYRGIEARLWQDPLAAAERGKSNLPGTDVNKAIEERVTDCSATQRMPLQNTHINSHVIESKATASHICNLVAELKGEKHLLTMAVTVGGGSYPEDAEFRRRIRYAVIAGLARKKYFPIDSEHLDYYTVRPYDDFKQQYKIPYETFINDSEDDRNHGTYRKILIAWIDENYLGQAIAPQNERSPLSVINDILNPIKQKLALEKPEFVIVGPHMSSALLDIYREMRSGRSYENLRNVNFYAYGATVSQRYIEQNINSANSNRSDSPLITRVMPQDDVVAEAIVDELKKRGFNFANCERVVLISELDTAYGRLLVDDAISGAFHGGGDACAPHDDRVLKRYYLRGIDGLVSPQKGSHGSPADPSTTPFVFHGANARKSDEFSGPSQSDYFRRFADLIAAEDSILRAKNSNGIGAIGILGSDVYDKMLILRALKPLLPNVHYFTTDYDVAFTNADDTNWTRNLIISSGFGGVLSRRLQGEILPFRSAYQTSAFLATQMAVSSKALGAESKINGNWAQEARIFEVSRTGKIIELAQDPPGSEHSGKRATSCMEEKDPDCVRPDEPYNSIPLLTSGERNAAIVALAFAVLVSLGLAQKQRTARQNTSSDVSSSYIHAKFGLVLALILLSILSIWNGVANRLTQNGTGELVFASEGLSIWPVIAIRLLIILFVIHFVRVASKRLDNNLIVTSKVMGIENNDERLENGILYSDYLITLFDPSKATFLKGRKIQEAWSGYKWLGRSGIRHLRAGIAAVIVTCLFWVFSEILGESGPAIRGSISSIFAVVSWFSILSIFYLVFYVADATTMFLAFVNDLEYFETEWPDPPKSYPPDAQIYDRFNFFAGSLPLPPRITRILNDFKDLKFIEKRTACILPLVWYPFFVLALWVLSRSNVFTSWRASGLVIIGEILALLVVFVCALTMSLAAESARRRLVPKVKNAILYAKNTKLQQSATEGWPTVDQLQALLEQIDGLRGGAFQPIWKQPLVTGLILPLLAVASKWFFDTSWFPLAWSING